MADVDRFVGQGAWQHDDIRADEARWPRTINDVLTAKRRRLDGKSLYAGKKP